MNLSKRQVQSESELRHEMEFIDALFSQDAITQFIPGVGVVNVQVQMLGKAAMFTFTRGQAIVIARGIEKAVAGDDLLERALQPIAVELRKAAEKAA